MHWSMRSVNLSFLTVLVVLGAACSRTEAPQEARTFSKIDSLTDAYLVLQDSMLTTWNIMANDENKKLSSLHDLVHEMMASDLFDKARVISLDQRLEQLKRIRFTQKTMANAYLVDEYDFASNSLITDVLGMAESSPEFVENKNFRSLIDYVRLADQRVSQYRAGYDSVASQFNAFIENHKAFLKDIDQNATDEKKPLFQVAGN